MGVANSKIDDDKALQLCRVRKKFVRQALNERCALACAHVAYIHSLKTVGTAVRKFVQPDFPLESSLYTSTSVTPDPVALTEKSNSHFSFSSPSVSQRGETHENLTRTPSPPNTGRYHVYRMNFRGSFVRKVEEKLPEVITETVTSFSTQNNTIPRSVDQTLGSQTNQFENDENENQPWDYFGLFHPIDNHLSSHNQRELDHDFVNDDKFEQIKEDEEVSRLEDIEEKIYSNGSQGSDSDEFDDPSSDTLVRKFKNLNREESNGFVSGDVPTVNTTESVISESEFSDDEKVNSPKLSPLKTKSSETSVIPEPKLKSVKDEDFEHKIPPKDFFSSIKEVEHLFVKASESGKEVPRMLEANKLHFRPLLPENESGMSTTASILKGCFSCGDDPSQIQEEPVQNSVKYLTWHRSASFRSTSSRNFLDPHSREEVEDLTSDLFENLYMISGSHASTLDRLFAWEKKLYDEVKASQLIRREYDMKCKSLREQETRCDSHKIDKTRAVVKDLHSRIRVAIHRIDSVSRRIEDMRDKELQPQLEELIEGLRKMWEVMFDCHKLQVHIITTAFSHGGMKLPLQSESRHHLALLLVEELGNLSSNFTKWINALNTYIQAINNWINKCVNFQEKSSKKRKWAPPAHLRLRNAGPPIYTTCGAWLDSLKNLPIKEVAEIIKGLATEISHLTPNQDKVQGKKKLIEGDRDQLLEIHTNQAFEVWNSTGYKQFQTSFVIFLTELSNFAESSVKIYSELQTNIEEAKRNYEHKMSQP